MYKRTFYLINFILIIFSLAGCGKNEKKTEIKNDTLLKKTSQSPPEKDYLTDFDSLYLEKNKTKIKYLDKSTNIFKTSFNDIYDAFMAVHYCLLKPDPEEAAGRTNMIKRFLKDAAIWDIKDSSAVEVWKKYAAGIYHYTLKIESTKDLQKQRDYFQHLVDWMIPTIEKFGLNGKIIYIKECKEENNGKGAYWLSEGKDVKNPYSNGKLVDCGKIKRQITF